MGRATLALLCVLVACAALTAAKSKRDTSHVKFVHVIFMNHLGAPLASS